MTDEPAPNWVVLNSLKFARDVRRDVDNRLFDAWLLLEFHQERMTDDEIKEMKELKLKLELMNP